MSLLNKLAIISDSLSPSSDALPFIDSAASFFMNSIPFELAKEYFIPVELTDGNGVIVGSKYSTVMLGKYSCRKLHPALKELAIDSNSQYYATQTDPVYYKQESKLFIIPNPTANNKGIVFKMPVAFIEANELINVPENSENIILIYAGYLILYSNARGARLTVDNYISRIVGYITGYENSLPNELVIPTFIFNESVPNPPTIDKTVDRFNLGFVDIPDVEVDLFIDTDFEVLKPEIDFDYTRVMPDFDISDISFPNIDLSAAFTALSNAENFIGNAEFDTDEVPKGAFWLDDEDPEMVQSAVQLAQQEVSRANSLAQTNLSTLQTYAQNIQSKNVEFEAKLSAYTSEIQAKVTSATGKIQVYIAEIDAAIKKLDADIKKVQIELEAKKLQLEKNNINIQQLNLELQEFQMSVQQKLQFNQQELEEYNISLGRFNTVLQKESTIHQNAVNKATQEFQASIGLANQAAQPIQFVSNEFQLHTSKYQMLMQESGMLYEKYMNEFNRFLGAYASKENNRESRKV